MIRKNHRSAAFSGIVVLLTIFSFLLAFIFFVGVFRHHEPGSTVTRGTSFLHFLLASGHGVLGFSAFNRKKWGVYGLATLALFASITFLSMGRLVELVLPLFALVTVLTSVLTKDWDVLD